MSQIIGPPPPLGPDFDDKVEARIAAHRRRRYAGSFTAALLVIAMTGVAISLSGAGGHAPETNLRAAADPTSSLPTHTTVERSTTTVASPSTTSAPVTVPGTVPSTSAPVSIVPPATAPPTTAPPTTVSWCPTGDVSATAVVHADRKGTDANGEPTWYVSATGTVTNNTSAMVDVSVNVWVTGATDPVEDHMLALDQTTAPLTMKPGATKSFSLKGYEPLAKDGSNAVAVTKPTSVGQGDILRRSHDEKPRAGCTPPGANASFELLGPSGGEVVGWPGM